MLIPFQRTVQFARDNSAAAAYLAGHARNDRPYLAPRSSYSCLYKAPELLFQSANSHISTSFPRPPKSHLSSPGELRFVVDCVVGEQSRDAKLLRSDSFLHAHLMDIFLSFRSRR